MRWAYRRLKTKREENLTKYVGFLYAYVKKAKIEKVMMRKVATAEKSFIIDNAKQDTFQFVSV